MPAFIVNEMETKSLKIFILLIFVAVLVGAMYFVSNFFASKNQSEGPIQNNLQATVGLPVKLIVPKIGVNAAIQYVGLAQDGSVGVPEGPYNVAWFKTGVRPGEKGSAIITGHYGSWGNGVGSVFDNLIKLERGDEIYVRDDKGNDIAFLVQDKKIYGFADYVPDIFTKNDDSYLNLITCTGTYLEDKKTYNNRLIIFAQKM